MKRIFAALAAFATVYLLAGFVAWNLDASTWDIGLRFYVAVIGLAVALFAAAVPIHDDAEIGKP